MGRLALLLDKEKKERLTVPVYLTEDKIKETNNFLTDNKKSLESGYVDILSNYLIQMNGYFNQLMIRGEGLTNQEEQTKYKEKAKLLEEQKNNKIKENLEEVIREYFNLYNEASNSIVEAIKHNDEKKKQAELISSVNDLLAKIDQAYVESDTNIDSSLLPVIELYKKALALEGTEQMATLTLLFDEEKRLLAKDRENRAMEVVTTKEKEFGLFDKINNQIVDKEFKKVNGLVYARYKLEDGSNYYAVIPDSNKILKEDKEFKTFSSFEMNRAKVEENLKLIVQNVMIYYDMNEYTRYVEALYKKQMTKEIEQAIDQYKVRLSNMENVLKSQLTFMDDIAPILNKKSSTKYPNIVYNDTLVKDFYPNELDNEQNKLMVRLADDTVSNNITTKEALMAIYGANIITDLIDEFATPLKEEPVSTPTVSENTSTSGITTNYQKISDYIKIRKDELDKVSNGNSNVTITEDNNSIYQNVNTIFDLNIAAAISDNQYSAGQGIYAISEYLKTGEVNRFTSSSNARALASNVQPNNYTSLLMENMIKSFAGSGKKSSEDATYLDRMQQVLSFVKDELSKDVFSANDMKVKLLSNDNLLSIAVKNFDYDYLDPISENSKLFEQAIEIGVKNNNSSAVRIRQALIDIKSIAKAPLESVVQQGQSLAA